MKQVTWLRIVHSVETDVYVWRYTLLMVHATQEEEEEEEEEEEDEEEEEEEEGMCIRCSLVDGSVWMIGKQLVLSSQQRQCFLHILLHLSTVKHSQNHTNCLNSYNL